MKKCFAIGFLVLCSCTSNVRDSMPEDLAEQRPTTILDAPEVDGANVSPGNRNEVDHGEYLVELLGCGACHTNGAIIGRPDLEKALAGSDIGIAFTTPMGDTYPAVVFAPNITPDLETGIGGWTDRQIVAAIRKGEGEFSNHLTPVMPWPGYAMLSDADAMAIAHYLQRIDPVSHQVPDNVPAGEKAQGRYVYFGIYEKL